MNGSSIESIPYVEMNFVAELPVQADAPGPSELPADESQREHVAWLQPEQPVAICRVLPDRRTLRVSVETRRKFAARIRSANDRLRCLIQAVAAGVAAYSESTIPLSMPPRKHGPITLSDWFASIRMKLIKVAATQGVEKAAADLKALSSECRRAWIEHSKPRHGWLNSLPLNVRSRPELWAQLSFIGRALPTGSARAIRKSLDTHQRDLTSTATCHPTDLASARSWAHSWARRYLPKRPGLHQTIGSVYSESASHGKTRAHGGLAADLVEMLEGAEAVSAPCPDWIPHSVWDLALAEVRQVSAAVASRPTTVPKGRVAVVSERGLKVRIVSAMDRSELVLSHLARRRLFLGLRKWPLVKEALDGNPRGVGAVFEGTTGLVISSDLRAASDLLPLDIVNAIVDGLEDSGCLLPEELMGLRLSTGPHELTWPGGRGTAVTSRGILMGLPTTWALLNLYHGWCWSAAKATDRPPRGTDESPSVRQVSRACICGDDLIGVSSPEGIRAYERRLLSTGAEFSAGKHFRSPDRGVFLEVLWEFRGSRALTRKEATPIWRSIRRKNGEGRRRKSRFRVDQDVVHTWTKVFSSNAIPLRGLVSGESPTGTKEARPPPEWWAAGNAESAYVDSGFSATKVHAAARTLRPSLAGRFIAAGIPPYLPRFLGGAGLIGPDHSKLDAPATHRKALASLVYGSEPGSVSKFERVWTDSRPGPYREMASGDADHCLSAFALRVGDDSGPPGWIQLGDPEDIREASIQRMGQVYHQMMGPDPDSVRYPSLVSVAKRIKAAREELLKQWLSAKPLNKPLPEVVSHWKEIRAGLLLWAPRTLPDFEDDPASNHRYNEYLLFGGGTLFSSTVRRFAIDAVSEVAGVTCCPP
nr:MAG: putative RNA-dependent RNA polymerase [Narnaviridae sp.]